MYNFQQKVYLSGGKYTHTQTTTTKNNGGTDLSFKPPTKFTANIQISKADISIVRSVSASSQVNQHELALAGLFLHK
jgi:hypothetical protein